MTAFKSLAALAAALALAMPARADLPTGTLSFITPSATVGSHDQIEVWVRYTLDTGSVPLNFSSNPLTGIDAADLPAQGQWYDPATQQFVTSTFTSYSGAYLNTYYQCSGTFTDGCGPSTSYAFNFFVESLPGKPSINFLESFTLAPGGYTDYLFGTFDPVASGAAPGTYTFYNAGLTLNVRGMDAGGHFLSAALPDLGATCPGQTGNCAFTRTVLAVPEPASWGLMALGLLGVAGVVRRRRG